MMLTTADNLHQPLLNYKPRKYYLSDRSDVLCYQKRHFEFVLKILIKQPIISCIEMTKIKMTKPEPESLCEYYVGELVNSRIYISQLKDVLK